MPLPLALGDGLMADGFDGCLSSDGNEQMPHDGRRSVTYIIYYSNYLLLDKVVDSNWGREKKIRIVK